MPNIRSRETVAERLWDWEFLNGALPGKIRPMDIDGIVEKNGHFLVLEGKPVGQNIPYGQRLTLERLAAQDETSVLILYGEPGDPEKMKLMGYHDEPVSTTKKRVRELVGRWVESTKTLS
jgi:hypothetical protein